MEGKRKGKMPAGKQMVAPFIGLFVGSAMFHPTRVLLCWRVFYTREHSSSTNESVSLHRNDQGREVPFTREEYHVLGETLDTSDKASGAVLMRKIMCSGERRNLKTTSGFGVGFIYRYTS